MRSTAGAIDHKHPAGGTLAIQRQLLVAALWLVLGLAIAFAALLIVRRISGAFFQPLSGVTIVTIAALVELAVVSFRRLAIRAGFTTAQYSVLSTQYSVAYVLPSVLALLTLISLTIPGTPLLALMLAWLIVLAGEAAQLHFHFRPSWASTLSPPPLPAPPAPIPPPLPSEIETELAEAEFTETETAEAEIPAGLLQQVTRVLEDDRESIHALVQANIAANDRLAIVHLSFCPPLANRPELTAHALDMDDADVRITQAETFGVRLEIRLPKVASAERSFLIELLGSAPTAKSA
jgi:hypothetical protein